MKKLSTMSISVLLAVMFSLCACSNDNLLKAVDDEVTVTVNFGDVGRSWSIATYNVVATAEDGTSKTSTSAENSLNIKLKKAVWSFVVSANDSDGTLLYKGSEEKVDLTAGTVTTLNVSIVKMSGNIVVDLSELVGVKESVTVSISRSGFESNSQSVTLSDSNKTCTFEGLAIGEWTVNIKGTNDTNAASIVKTATVLASASVTVSNLVATTTSTTTTTTIKYDESQSSYYWTNKDNHYGTNKTISSWSDWTAAEQIAQCAAYDDPRTWRGVQEVAYDVYALYAAYDDTNLYLMVELVNLPDDNIFMAHNYAGSDNAWWDNRDCPIGFIIKTEGKATSPMIGTTGPIWGSINFTDSNGFDYLLYHSSKYGYAEHKSAFVGVGTPGFFRAASDGTFNYDDDCLSVCSGTTATSPGSESGTKKSGISIRYNRTCVVSGSNIYYEATPTDNRTTSGQTGADLLASTNYKKASASHKTSLDMSYWYTIPLATLGIDKAYITSTGIGVRQLTPNGGSLMDCCPWDVSMVNDASDPCSDDESSSHEKEDKDDITSRQARVGGNN